MTKKKKKLDYVSDAKEAKMVDYPELDRINDEYNKLRLVRMKEFLKYFLRNIAIIAVLTVLFYAAIWALAKSMAGV